MHDYTRACLETDYFPNEAAAPLVFGEIASILQRVGPQKGTPYSLGAEVKNTVQEILSLGLKGRRIKILDTKPKPTMLEDQAA